MLFFSLETKMAMNLPLQKYERKNSNHIPSFYSKILDIFWVNFLFSNDVFIV